MAAVRKLSSSALSGRGGRATTSSEVRESAGTRDAVYGSESHHTVTVQLSSTKAEAIDSESEPATPRTA